MPVRITGDLHGRAPSRVLALRVRGGRAVVAAHLEEDIMWRLRVIREPGLLIMCGGFRPSELPRYGLAPVTQAEVQP